MKFWLVGAVLAVAVFAGAMVLILRSGVESGVIERAPSSPNGTIRIATFNAEGLAGPDADEPSSVAHLEWLAEFGST